ncbi:thiol reductant ABC exporter subunit CydD, partial [Nitratireductor sp. ZSWI3]|uniref:thiol reductant ABC exporter subunit CydD n=1 Tax=Nitratireductor sp. ZSWI3 TaxID=2966359 RepID=UPI00214F6F55
AGTRLAFREARRKLGALRREAVDAIAAASPLDAARPSSGFAASALAEQAETVVPYLARFGPARLKAAIVPAMILLCVLALSWSAALILLAAAPLIPLFMALVGWKAKEASERQMAEMGSMNAFLLDRLRGLTTIRAFDAVDRTAGRLRANAEDLRSRTMAVLRIAFLSSAVLELFAALGVAMVAVYVGFHLLGNLNFGAWGGKLSLGEGLFILLLAPAFFEPLRELSTVWHDRAAGQAALAVLERLPATGARMPGALDDRAPQTGTAGALSLEVRDLRFRHAQAAPPVFDGFCLNLQPGERIAVMAPSGGGKSTLLALIAGLAAAEAGSIRIGGQPMQGPNTAEMRARIAWVSQDPHIFAGTLASNVRLGRPGIGRQEVAAALRAARLDRIAAVRGAAAIGESGIGLSGGEALRLALARAAATPDAGIILADEPTAHLDRKTAGEITGMLLAIAAGRTLVVATHDPLLAARMDRVVTLQPPARCGGRP